MKIAELYTEISVKGMSNVGRGLNTLNRGLKKTERALNEVGALAVKSFAAVGAAVAGVTKLYADQEQAEKKLETVLKSTGNAAGFTAEQLKQQARELQKITTFGDEAIIEMQALLATFVNIKNTEFRDAEMSIMNISTLMGTSLKESAVQVGKALNDPIKGVSALTRVGVSFTDKQKETIEQLQKTGQTAKAQRIILAELNKEFGGQAAAAANTFAGKMKQLRNSVSDVGEAVVGFFIPHITEAAKVLKRFVDAIQVEVIDALGGDLSKLDFYQIFDKFLFAFPQVEEALILARDLIEDIKKSVKELSTEAFVTGFGGGAAAIAEAAGGAGTGRLRKGAADLVGLLAGPGIGKLAGNALGVNEQTQKEQLNTQKDIAEGINKLVSVGGGLQFSQ